MLEDPVGRSIQSICGHVASVRLAAVEAAVHIAVGAVCIDHTLVDERLRGLGVARRLLDAAVAWARSSHTKLAATCPYAKAQFEKDASIRDVYDA